MGTAPKLAAFAVALLAAFGATFGLGRAVGPIEEPDPVPERSQLDGGHGPDAGADPAPDRADDGGRTEDRIDGDDDHTGHGGGS